MSQNCHRYKQSKTCDAENSTNNKIEFWEFCLYLIIKMDNIDLNKICRTCLSSVGTMESLYENATLIDMITSCAKVKVRIRCETEQT